MATEIVIRNCTLETFKNMFKSKKEYLTLIREMDLKERLLSWKPSNTLEANLKKDLEEKALIKIGAAGLRTTSYLVKEGSEFALVYISYGGKQLCVSREGREEDIGGYFYATQAGPDLKLKMKTRYEYHKTRYILITIIGFIFFAIPGLVFGLYFLASQWLTIRKINKNIVPVIIRTFESLGK